MGKIRSGELTLASRHTVKPGDIFEIVEGDRKFYFQFVLKDVNYMAGHLIRVFDIEIDSDQEIGIQELTNIPIKFYTHTRAIEGLKDELWKKYGNSPINDDFQFPKFRSTPDRGMGIAKSSNWFLWQKDPSNKIFIGEMTDEYSHLPVAGIYPPSAIVKWIVTGDNGFKVPD